MKAHSIETGMYSDFFGFRCLGPLLFLLYVNDVTSVISDKCTCKLYANDLKLYSEISVVDDYCVLQDVIDKVKLWSDEWQLSMSVRKCAAIVSVILLTI